MNVAISLILTGGLAVLFGATVCWGLVDVSRTLWNVERIARLREHWPWCLAYVALVILVPLAVGLYFGWLFARMLFDR